MDLVVKLKLIWFLCVCALALTAARNLQKQEVEPLSETAAIRTPPKYTIEPLQTVAKVSADNSIIPSRDTLIIADGNKLNTIASKTGDSKLELFETPLVKISEKFKDTSASSLSGDTINRGELNLIPDDKIVTENCETEQDALPIISEHDADAINKPELKLRSLTKDINQSDLLNTELKLDSERIRDNEKKSEILTHINIEDKQTILIPEGIPRKEINQSITTSIHNLEGTRKEIINSPANSIRPEIIDTKYDASREKEIPKEERREAIASNSEKILIASGANATNNLELPTSLPPFENLRGTEKRVEETSPTIPIIDASKAKGLLNNTKDSREELHSILRTTEAPNIIDRKETKGNQVGLETDQKNLRLGAGLALGTGGGLGGGGGLGAGAGLGTGTGAGLTTGISLSLPPLFGSPSIAAQPAVGVSAYPATTGLTSQLQTQIPTITAGSAAPYGIGATVGASRPAQYPIWYPNYSATALPSSVSYVPNYYAGPGLAANNQYQGSLGFGILGTPLGPNGEGITTISVSRNFDTQRDGSVKPIDTKINNMLLEPATAGTEFHKLNINKTEVHAAIRGNPQVLHLFFPLKYLYPKQVSTEALTSKIDGVTKERKMSGADGATNSQNEHLRAAVENQVDPITSKSDEKTSLIFRLELPKPVLQFVKGVLDTFTPLIQN